ncbi:MAG: flippase-like domain-containing protein [Candidatus Brocadiaceae bacterium]|nr:flippase-like domain-containing protein [Candidatus Brocadiaceae bacterium]
MSKGKIIKKGIQIVISFGLPIAFLLYLFSIIKLDDLLLTIKSVSLPWICIGFFFYCVNQVFRSIRFYCLIHSIRPNFRKLFKVQSLYIALNYLLPFRTGEISYVYLARRYLDLPMANCISSLVVSRFSDYVFLMLCYVFIAFHMKMVIPPWIGLIAKGGVVCALLAAFFFFLYVFKDTRYLSSFFQKIKTHPFRSKNWFIKRITEQLQKIVLSFKEISNVRIFIQTVLMTIAVWFSIFLTFYIIVHSMGHRISFLHIILVALMAMMSRMFQGVANLGSHEIGWYGALLLVDFSNEDASLVAVSSHIIILGYTLIVSLYSRLTLKCNNRQDTLKILSE